MKDKEQTSYKIRTYVLGQFEGKYYGYQNDNLGPYHTIDFDIHIYQASLYRTIKISEEQYSKISKKENYYDLGQINDLKIELDHSLNSPNTVYIVDTLETHICNLKLSKVQEDGRKTYGTISGILGAVVDVKEINQIKKEKPAEEAKVGAPNPSKTNKAESKKRKENNKPGNDFSIKELVNQGLSAIPLILGGIYLAFIIGSILQALGPISWIILGTATGISVFTYLFPALIHSLVITPLALIWNILAKISFFLFFTFIVFLLFFIYTIEHEFYILASILASLLIFTLINMYSRILRPSVGMITSYSGLIFVGIAFFMTTLSFHSNSNINPIPSQNKRKSIISTDSFPRFIEHHLTWKDYAEKEYKGNLRVDRHNYIRSKKWREQYYRIYDDQSSLSQPYEYTLDEEDGRTSFLLKFSDSLRTVYQLDSIDFAKAIVSMVQSIPYVLIYPENCPPNINIPCIDNINLGFCTPIEFSFTLNGDCDTRALFLFSIFQQHGFDVILLVSQKYQHAILGINLPIDGTTFYHNRKRYIVWETTAEGWKPGVLPPNCNNLEYWEVLISSDNNPI